MAMQIGGNCDFSQNIRVGQEREKLAAERAEEKQAAERAEEKQAAERAEEKQAAERAEEKQAAERTEKAAEAEKGTDEKARSFFEPRDEYISSEKSGREATGLYRLVRNENGSRKLFFDDPKAFHGSRKEEPKANENHPEGAGKAPKAGEGGQENQEICVGNTDAVDREISKLKEKKQVLEQQIQSASGDERKIRELEKKLAQVEQELSQKDNDTYRRQHTVFSQTT